LKFLKTRHRPALPAEEKRANLNDTSRGTMSYYPDFVDHDGTEYQKNLNTEGSGVDTFNTYKKRTNSGLQYDKRDNGKDDEIVFVEDEDGEEFYDDSEVVIVVNEVEDDFSDDEYQVDKTEQSHAFDDDQARTSVSSFSANDEIEDDAILSYDFSRDYDYDKEYQMEDWESHRGTELRRKVTSQPPPLRSVQSGFNDEYYEGNKGPSCLLIFTLALLSLELGAAIIAVLFFEPFVECCGDSFVSTSDISNDSWNQALYGISIAYLTWVIVDFPVVAISKEPVFLFNPMIGFLLCMHMLYVTNTTYAYAIYGLETCAMLGQTYVLMQLHRNAELCIHSLFNFIMCGIVVYSLIELTRQGGYCIVGGSVQGVFSEATCNIHCVDEASCNVCDGNVTQCFIPFQSIS
jgi:hypothetical protein